MKKATKFLSILCLCMAFTLTLFNVNAKASEDTMPVQLCYAYPHVGGNYHLSYIIGYVKVKNLSYNKNVTIHATIDNTNYWCDFPASYVKTDTDGYEVWKFETPETVFSKCQFAIKCEMNGQTYWDNNNGNNYWINGGNAFGKNKIAVTRSELKNASTVSNSITEFYGDITLQNMDYNKDIIIRYTTDNWKSYKEQKAQYKNSGNDGATEYWGFDVILDQPASNVKYSVLYRANGQEYWDNNFGSNYDASISFGGYSNIYY